MFAKYSKKSKPLDDCETVFNRSLLGNSWFNISTQGNLQPTHRLNKLLVCLRELVLVFSFWRQHHLQGATVCYQALVCLIQNSSDEGRNVYICDKNHIRYLIVLESKCHPFWSITYNIYYQIDFDYHYITMINLVFTFFNCLVSRGSNIESIYRSHSITVRL